MDHSNNINAEHESRYDLERVEPGELLEDSWFFGNLLHSKSRMLRSLSDTCTSSSYAQESSPSPAKSYEETYESIKKLSTGTGQCNLIKAPSVPLERRDRKAGDPHRSKRSNRKKASSKGLVRAPSLPTSLDAADSPDEDIEYSMGKLIRQASMNYSDTLPPRTQYTSKGLSRSCSISRHRSRRKPEVESVRFDLESEELKGFKDLGFDFDEKDLSPNTTSIVSGLQEKKEIEDDDGEINRRPYRSEAWRAQSYSAPPVTNWGGKRSTEDMKAQIKFWARAVASNVRQEC